MEIEYKVGDLLRCSEANIAHGCNLKGSMDAGDALQIKNKYPYHVR